MGLDAHDMKELRWNGIIYGRLLGREGGREGGINNCSDLVIVFAGEGGGFVS